MTMSIAAPPNPLPRGMMAMLDATVVPVRQNGARFAQEPNPVPPPPPPPKASLDPNATRGTLVDMYV